MSCHVATFAKDLGEVMSCRVATFARNLETYDMNICLDPDDIYVKPKIDGDGRARGCDRAAKWDDGGAACVRHRTAACSGRALGAAPGTSPSSTTRTRRHYILY